MYIHMCGYLVHCSYYFSVLTIVSITLLNDMCNIQTHLNVYIHSYVHKWFCDTGSLTFVIQGEYLGKYFKLSPQTCTFCFVYTNGEYFWEYPRQSYEITFYFVVMMTMQEQDVCLYSAIYLDVAAAM